MIISFAVTGAEVAIQYRDAILPSSTQNWWTLQLVVLHYTSKCGWCLHGSVSLAVVVGSRLSCTAGSEVFGVYCGQLEDRTSGIG